MAGEHGKNGIERVAWLYLDHAMCMCMYVYVGMYSPWILWTGPLRPALPPRRLDSLTSLQSSVGIMSFALFFFFFSNPCNLSLLKSPTNWDDTSTAQAAYRLSLTAGVRGELPPSYWSVRGQVDCSQEGEGPSGGGRVGILHR